MGTLTTMTSYASSHGGKPNTKQSKYYKECRVGKAIQVKMSKEIEWKSSACNSLHIKAGGLQTYLWT